jgi:hypothetical protein
MKNYINDQDQAIKNIEENTQIMTDKYNEILIEKKHEESKIVMLEKEIQKLKIENKALRDNETKHHDTILDLQCRSMQYNLLFFGIAETELNHDEYEDTEAVLKTFLQEDMQIDIDVELQNVHRLGKRKKDQINPRPIIAKFKNNKERDLVKYSAPETLQGTRYGIKEQFPREIEDRRKPLYKEMKAAKERGSEVKLVRDKLYIDNELFVTNEVETDSSTIRKSNSQTNQSTDNVKGRVFYQSRRRKYANNIKSTTMQQSNISFTDTNRYEPLQYAHSVSHKSKQHFTKRTAISPLDSNMKTKKYKENTCEIADSSCSHVEESYSSERKESSIVRKKVENNVECIDMNNDTTVTNFTGDIVVNTDYVECVEMTDDNTTEINNSEHNTEKHVSETDTDEPQEVV